MTRAWNTLAWPIFEANNGDCRIIATADQNMNPNDMNPNEMKN